jgi:hypothetical protein
MQEEIPYGYCHCGCGEKTKIRTRDDQRYGYVKGTPQKYIYKHNGDDKTYVDTMGYTMVYCPDHPRATKKGYVLEHILIAEKALGQYLPPEAVVHHYGEKSDNTKLVVCENQKYHLLLHRRAEALQECGHPDWRKCSICKKWDDPTLLVIRPRRSAYHILCSREKAKSNYYQKKTA